VCVDSPYVLVTGEKGSKHELTVRRSASSAARQAYVRGKFKPTTPSALATSAPTPPTTTTTTTAGTAPAASAAPNAVSAYVSHPFTLSFSF